MDTIFEFLFFMWLIIAFVSGSRKKKNLPPTTQSDEIQQESESPTFEIPTLANDPNVQPLPMSTEIVRVIDAAEEANQQREFLKQKLSAAKKISQEEFRSESRSKNDSPLNFSHSEAMNAMILAEIFSKPKSLRRK
ncbi:MAG: hypothetical protein IJ728_04320 [Selenomonadaceae bacterium]|nr:hypothetical protein [Selenomonadaceae bacterium]